MTTCARCGLPLGSWTEADKCSAHEDDNDSGVIDCRNRELANLRSLLRSVTGKLEEASTQLEHAEKPRDMYAVKALIDSVLEVLS